MTDSLAPGLEALQRRLGHRFRQPDLLVRALTHRSYSADHYERLEFLGDAVLGLAVSTLLVERLPQQAEGELSRARASLVRALSGAALSRRMQQPRFRKAFGVFVGVLLMTAAVLIVARL